MAEEPCTRWGSRKCVAIVSVCRALTALLVLFCADARFGAGSEAADVLAVEHKNEHGKDQCEHCLKGQAVQHHVNGRHRRGNERRKRRKPRDRGDREPRSDRQQTDRPGKREHDTEKRRHALAAAKAKPDGKNMAEKRSKASKYGCDHAVLRSGEQHRHRALPAITDEGCGSGPAFSRPQHIGGADVAGANLADVARTGRPRKHQAERNGPECVPEYKRRKKSRRAVVPVDRERVEHRRTTYPRSREEARLFIGSGVRSVPRRGNPDWADSSGVA